MQRSFVEQIVEQAANRARVPLLRARGFGSLNVALFNRPYSACWGISDFGLVGGLVGRIRYEPQSIVFAMARTALFPVGSRSEHPLKSDLRARTDSELQLCAFETELDFGEIKRGTSKDAKSN